MSKSEIQDIKETDWSQFLPGISIDCVIFGYHDRELKILILEYKNTGYFALPGGFIYKDEDLDEAAKRTLRERTSLDNIYLDQFHTFGNLERYDTEYMRGVLEANGIAVTEDHFLMQRFISVGYYALVDFSKAHPTPDKLSDSCGWCDLDELPELIQDHRLIIQYALDALKENIEHMPISYNLMSETFTMGELRSLHETILEKKINRTSFHRKMVNSGNLKRIGKKKTGGAHRAPYLYRFVKDN